MCPDPVELVALRGAQALLQRAPSRAEQPEEAVRVGRDGVETGLGGAGVRATFTGLL